MSRDAKFRVERLTIVGVGLIGGSIGRDFRVGGCYPWGGDLRAWQYAWA